MVHAYTENASCNCHISGDLAVYMSFSVRIEMPDFRHTDIVDYDIFSLRKTEDKTIYFTVSGIQSLYHLFRVIARLLKTFDKAMNNISHIHILLRSSQSLAVTSHKL